MPAKHAARARLFLPFDSLKGFREYLAEKEQPQESKKMLSEDDCERIDHLLRQLRPGDMAEVIWYAGGHHVTQKGMISCIDVTQRTLTIVSTTIPIPDIVAIRKEE
ncbi:MAG TPA: hypothetical protein H9702_01020 [Candidatus Merdibacter merdavium]|uniref:YolD-like family protein n=1 Tax=Candidatus Merdibacter merdavium TaxID=2838692 RepID=A0A9D2SU03_9FIRM|nr:hypothetical protein [Candidatus Merdibacter merdavium]